MTMPAKSDPQAKSPDLFTTEILPDGTLHVIYVKKNSDMGCLVATGIFFLSFAATMAGRVFEGHGFQWHTFFAAWRDPLLWLLPGFMLLGAYLIFAPIRGRFSRAEWHVAPNLIEVQYYKWKRPASTRRFTSGRITVTRRGRLASESKDVIGYHWFLQVQPDRPKSTLASTMVIGPTTDPKFVFTDAEYVRIAELLAQHTGWELAPLLEPAAV